MLEEFCGAAAKRLDIEIDSRSLDVEPGMMGVECVCGVCVCVCVCVWLVAGLQPHLAW